MPSSTEDGTNWYLIVWRSFVSLWTAHKLKIWCCSTVFSYNCQWPWRLSNWFWLLTLREKIKWPGRLCQVNKFRHRLKIYYQYKLLVHDLDGSTKCTHRDLFMPYVDAYVTPALTDNGMMYSPSRMTLSLFSILTNIQAHSRKLHIQWVKKSPFFKLSVEGFFKVLPSHMKVPPGPHTKGTHPLVDSACRPGKM